MTSFQKIRHALRVAKVDFIHDGEHRDFEQNGVQPRAYDDDIDIAVGQGRHRDVLFIEPEKPQKVHKITLDEPQGAQVGKFAFLKVQTAQGANFFTDFLNVGCKIDTTIAAFESVLDLGSRKLVQDHLHHGELIKVGIQQAGDDHGKCQYNRLFQPTGELMHRNARCMKSVHDGRFICITQCHTAHQHFVRTRPDMRHDDFGKTIPCRLRTGV